MRGATKAIAPSRQGFSLLELLLVVALVALLAGILLPSLHGARAESRRARCLANMHSLSTASSAYCAESSRDTLLPVHGAADQNPRQDDGFYDYGGADGAVDVWAGRCAPAGIQSAQTRPLNKTLGLWSSARRDYEVFRCPDDQEFDPPVDYAGWPIWDSSFRRRSAFNNVGTSYWGNAVRTKGARGQTLSFGPFLRQLTRIPAPGLTVLYMEMPALFNLARLNGAEEQPVFRSIGINGWHSRTPRFNYAFCDGHTASETLPAGWLSDPSTRQPELRAGALRFDCLPDPPVLDLPVDDELRHVTSNEGGLQ